MNSSNKRFIVIGLLIGCSLILLFSVIILVFFFIPLYREYSVYQIIHVERIDRLRILLCEPFSTETTPEEIISKLEEMGDITVAGNNITDPNLSIVFNEPRLKEIYGRFTITFHDGQYVGASIPAGFEKIEVICSYR